MPDDISVTSVPDAIEILDDPLYISNSDQPTLDNSALIEYYSKLKQAWENLDALDPIPYCTCGAMDACTCQMLKRVLDIETNSKLIQFLMGLNNAFEAVRTTVLSMKPLSALSKALGFLQKIERQRKISESTIVHPESSTYASARSSYVQQTDWKRQKLDTNTVKPQKLCTHCQKVGHNLDECFNFKTCDHCGKTGHVITNCLIRTRAWNNTYSRGRGRHTNSSNRSNVYHMRANNVDTLPVADNPLEVSGPGSVDPSPKTQVPCMDQAVVDGIVHNIIQQVLKAYLDHASAAASSSSINFARTDLYPQAFTVAQTYGQISWIVDIWASNHMTSNEDIIYNIRLLQKPVMIGLPDGTIKLVHKMGDISLTPTIHLKNVLVVPDFKQNLLSVSKLIQSTPMIVLFTSKYCASQDLCSKVPLGLAEKKGGLNWITPLMKNKEQDGQLPSSFMQNASNIREFPFSASNNKYQVPDLLKTFLICAETQFGTKVKTFRSDHGT
ncbi:uncharacterized protein LOC141588705 [Silene latifolia]|uniref:uncharacterized protein LOC141588705 n=1 Tax=Silene latifolia TaxID=37657 RepID=UPI003D76A752